MNPNFMSELKRDLEPKLRAQQDAKTRALAARLKGKDPERIRRELAAAGFINIKDELVEAMQRGRPIPSKVRWK